MSCMDHVRRNGGRGVLEAKPPKKAGEVSGAHPPMVCADNTIFVSIFCSKHHWGLRPPSPPSFAAGLRSLEPPSSHERCRTCTYYDHSTSDIIHVPRYVGRRVQGAKPSVKHADLGGAMVLLPSTSPPPQSKRLSLKQ